MKTLFKTYEDAVQFVRDIDQIMAKFHVVTVADVKNLRNEHATLRDDYQGWYRLLEREIEITPYSSGYVVILPSPIPCRPYDETSKRSKMTKEEIEYCRNDVIALERCISRCTSIGIKKVIFNDPATIVFWSDGDKTIVKAYNEKFDPEKGLSMAIAKRVLGKEYTRTFKNFISDKEVK